MENARTKRIRIAAIGDLHVRDTDRGKWKDYFATINREADVLVIAGDITDTGDEDEATLFTEELPNNHIPMVGVLGNHDHEKGRQKIIKEILLNANMQVLDGESTIVEGIGFAGIKGFGGGFGARMLARFGEDMMKSFVQEAVDEGLKLERALARLGQHQGAISKIAIMHYAPIPETVAGEPLEIYPFLGSSRLLEPLQRTEVAAVFHGHAHMGKHEGAAPDGTKVWNVSLPVLARQGAAHPFHLMEMEITADDLEKLPIK